MDLTPYEGVRAASLSTHRDYPDTVLISLNKRDRKLMDVHRIQLSSGVIELDTENSGTHLPVSFPYDCTHFIYVMFYMQGYFVLGTGDINQR